MGLDLYVISTWIIPLVLAITLHEAAHGYVARAFGDDTASQAGRVTLNPIPHIHPVGTVIMPGLLLLSGLPALGFARPVPVNFGRLNHPKRDMIWVAAAGPGANILMALTAAALLNVVTFLPGDVRDWVDINLANAIRINLVLAVFNMIPLPPLDGGRVVTGLLPPDLSQRYAQLGRYGIVIVIGAIFVPYLISSWGGPDFNILVWIIWPIVQFLYDLILQVFWLIR